MIHNINLVGQYTFNKSTQASFHAHQIDKKKKAASASIPTIKYQKSYSPPHNSSTKRIEIKEWRQDPGVSKTKYLEYKFSDVMCLMPMCKWGLIHRSSKESKLQSILGLLSKEMGKLTMMSHFVLV